MNTTVTKTLLIAVMLLIAGSSLCQEYTWRLTLTNGDDFKNVALERLIEDSLMILQVPKTYKIPVRSLYMLRKEKESKFEKGIVVGALLGATAGGLIGVAIDSDKANCQPGNPDECFGSWSLRNTKRGFLIGGVTGFLLGGAIGAGAGKDEIHDFSQLNPEQKLALIKSLMK
jgi:hypothetical protein